MRRADSSQPKLQPNGAQQAETERYAEERLRSKAASRSYFPILPVPADTHESGLENCWVQAPRVRIPVPPPLIKRPFLLAPGEPGKADVKALSTYTDVIC